MAANDPCVLNDYYYGLIGSRIRAFDWHQNQRPRMTLNGRNVTLAEINKISAA